MKRLSTTIIAMMLAATALWSAEPANDNNNTWHLTARAGFSIGGTAPLGMPASIRKINEFGIKPNFEVGVDVQKSLWNQWGLMAGLHFEGKGMHTDAEVKSYYTAIVQGGEPLDGKFTGSVITNVRQWMLTIPVNATFEAAENVTIYGGPYLSILTAAGFDGYVYNGYLRKGNPTGEKVVMGDDEGSRGFYDFADDMRRLQLGVNVGVDWRVYRQWGVYANLKWGVTGIHKSDFTAVPQTLYPIYGTIGITYQIK